MSTSQTPGSHGSGLSCAAPGAASYEAISVVDEVQRSLFLMAGPPHTVLHSCFCALSTWLVPLFLQQGVKMGSVYSRQIITTDTSLTGWGTVFKGRTGCHVIVRTDNMVVVSHINHQGGSWSRTPDRHTRRLFLWAQDRFLSLRAVHIPGL